MTKKLSTNDIFAKIEKGEPEMIVLSSEGRTVFIGTLEKWKKGKGEAEDKLTIMSLKGLTMPGDTPKKEKITVLCWNYLSERARKLNVGDVVTVQVAFEAGNSRRGTACKKKKVPVWGNCGVS